jgi:DNA-binding transcriptional MerR regulator
VAAPSGAKDPSAFRTIGELSAELGIAQHILRYWESRFSQLKPLQRAGNRRYYRPEDVELVRRIHSLLSHQGYTVRGVQQLLKDKAPLAEPVTNEEDLVSALKRIRAELVEAIGAD